MSMYSGKCDLYDHFCMSCDNADEINDKIRNSKFFISHDNKPIPIMITNYQELIPFFPYIIGMGAFNNGHSVIWLSSRSHVDTEESEHFLYALKRELTIYKKCKRKHTEYVYEEGSFRDRQVFDEVSKNGLKADVSHLHKDYYDKYYRKYLALEMKKYGYDDYYISQWVYQGRNYDWKVND